MSALQLYEYIINSGFFVFLTLLLKAGIWFLIVFLAAK